jgi:inositol oxygenase
MKTAEFNPAKPLENMEEWEDFLKERYPEGKPGFLSGTEQKSAQFRNYETTARPSVREFYRLNHRFQTFNFVQEKKRDFLALNRRQMGVWEALEYLNTLVDDSDPDTDLSQLEHLLQTAEQIRQDGHPRWFILAGLIHDLGKILVLYGEPQWAVVGDTFPVGCAYSDTIVFHPFFADNPDSQNPRYQSPLGVYGEGCGLGETQLSWGHDEYLFHVVKDRLPTEALHMIRYHSFYPWHREGAYARLTSEQDRAMLKWVKAFNPYDLYTKDHRKPDVAALRPFYEDLIAEYLPGKLRW